MPNSGTPEVRNLWAESNIDVPGLWVFKLSQNGQQPGVEPAARGSSTPEENLSFLQLCFGEVSPNRVSMWSMGETLSISQCFLPTQVTTQLQFKGSHKMPQVVPATYQNSTFSISSTFPDNWGVNEQVQVSLVIDGILLQGSKTFFYFSPTQNSKGVNLELIKDEMSLSITWPASFFDDKAALDLLMLQITEQGENVLLSQLYLTF